MNRAGLHYTFQVEWIRGRGVLLWLAMVMGAIGGGAFLVSTVLDFRLGSTVGFLVATVGKGGFHIAFLGRPERFWRAISRPQSSWISRGIIFLILFGAVALAYLVLVWVGDGTGLATQILRWIGIALAVMLITYDGFALAAATGIPFWNSSIMPMLYGVAALLGGVGLTLSFLPYVMDVVEPTLGRIEVLDRYVLLALSFLILSYLWTSFYISSGARQSVLELVKGRLHGVFVLTCVMAVLVPGAVAIYGIFGHIPLVVLTVVAVLEVGGDFALKYTILRAGMYASLAPRFMAPVA